MNTHLIQRNSCASKKKTIHTVLTEENIIASWKSCGFDISVSEGVCTRIYFRDEFGTFLRTEVDGPEAQAIADSFAQELKSKK